MILKFSGQTFEKHSNIKFYFKKSVQWEPSCSTWTGGQTGPSQQSPFAILRTRLKIPFTLSEFEIVQSASKPASRLNQISFIPSDELRTHAVFHSRSPILIQNLLNAIRTTMAPMSGIVKTCITDEYAFLDIFHVHH